MACDALMYVMGLPVAFQHCWKLLRTAWLGTSGVGPLARVLGSVAALVFLGCTLLQPSCLLVHPQAALEKRQLLWCYVFVVGPSFVQAALALLNLSPDIPARTAVVLLASCIGVADLSLPTFMSWSVACSKAHALQRQQRHGGSSAAASQRMHASCAPSCSAHALASLTLCRQHDTQVLAYP
jgi:hypothetical protein